MLQMGGIALQDWERRAVGRMDLIRLAFLNRQADAPEVSARPLSADLFDALF